MDIEEKSHSDRDDSRYYGLWPTFIGLLLGAMVMWLMFTLADGTL